MFVVVVVVIIVVAVFILISPLCLDFFFLSGVLFIRFFVGFFLSLCCDHFGLLCFNLCGFLSFCSVCLSFTLFPLSLLFFLLFFPLFFSFSFGED